MPRRRAPSELRRTWTRDQSPRPPTPYPFVSPQDISNPINPRLEAYDWIRRRVRYVRPPSHLRPTPAHRELTRERKIASQNDEISRRPAVPLNGITKSHRRHKKQVAFLLPEERPPPVPLRTPDQPSSAGLNTAMGRLSLNEGENRCPQCGAHVPAADFGTDML